MAVDLGAGRRRASIARSLARDAGVCSVPVAATLANRMAGTPVSWTVISIVFVACWLPLGYALGRIPLRSVATRFLLAYLGFMALVTVGLFLEGEL